MRRVLSYLAVSVCLACGTTTTNEPDGGGGGDGGGDGDFTISVAPASVTIPIGQSEGLAISVARVGSIGDVTLSARDLPAGVTAEFATNPVAGGASDLTITANAGSQPGTSTITIAGTAGTTERTATLEVTLTSITVSGKVLRADSIVVLVGKGAVTPDGEGNFSFTDVVPPYDLYTVATTFIGAKGVYYYEGLLRPDPTVLAEAYGGLIVFPTPQGNASVTGTLTGTFSAANEHVVFWSNGGNPDTTIAAGGGYGLTAQWYSGVTNVGTMYALQWSLKGTNAPDVFTGFGSSGKTLNDEGAAVVDVALTTPTTVAITGTVTAPGGYPDPSIVLRQRIDTRSHVLWTYNTTTIDASGAVLPVGMSTFYASSSLGAGVITEYVVPSIAVATDVSFAMPAAATLDAPVASATNVGSTTAFQYTPPPSSVSEVSIFSSNVAWYLITTASEVTIPNVPEAPIPASASSSWHVQNFGPFASVDEAAGPDTLRFLYESTSDGPQRFHTKSEQRSFTTSASP
jgi:hypothetical protein